VHCCWMVGMAPRSRGGLNLFEKNHKKTLFKEFKSLHLIL
jgi:hypothetical protein